MYRKGALRNIQRRERNDNDDLILFDNTTSASDDGYEDISCNQTMIPRQLPQLNQERQQHKRRKQKKKKQQQREQFEKQQEQHEEQERQPQEHAELAQLQPQQQDCNYHQSVKINERRKSRTSYYVSKIWKKSSIIIDVHSDGSDDESYIHIDNDEGRLVKLEMMKDLPRKKENQSSISRWWAFSLVQQKFFLTLFCFILFVGTFKRYVRNNHQHIGIFDDSFQFIDIYHEYINLKGERESNKLLKLKLDEELQLIQNHNIELEKEQVTMKKELESAQALNVKLESELDFMREKVFESIHERKASEQMMQNVLLFRNEVKRNIQDFSRSLLLSKYGAGPYYAEIIVEFHPESNAVRELGISKLGSIIIEIAPIDEMPHTVYWFLEQVAEKSYDDRKVAFHINDDHIIQAGADHDYVESVLHRALNTNETTTPTGDNLSGNINQKDLAKLIFREYSPNYTHKPYTLGLPGISVGKKLDFYISLKDNTIKHGPSGNNTNNKRATVVTGGSEVFGGSSNNNLHFLQSPSVANAQLLQNDNSLSEDADPCFARVIHGFHVVDNIHLSATVESNVQVPYRDDRLPRHMMKHSVAIRRISLLHT